MDPFGSRVETRPVAIVTGASGGFGEAIVRRLAQKGWLTIGIARNEQKIADLAEEVGGQYHACDLTNRAHLRDVAMTVQEEHPAIQLLVNSVGVGLGKTFSEAQEHEISRILSVNSLGLEACARCFGPALEQGQADLIDIVSVAGSVVLPPSGPYSASKHAQLATSRALREELRDRGIKVHTLLPGFAETEGFPQEGRLPWPFSLRSFQTTPDKVAEAVTSRIGRRSGEVYLPSHYRLGAIATAIAPVTSARLLRRVFADKRPAA